MPATEAEREAGRRYKVKLTGGMVIDGKNYYPGSVVDVVSKDAGTIISSNQGHLVDKETPTFEAEAIPHGERVRSLAERNAGSTRAPDGTVPGAKEPGAAKPVAAEPGADPEPGTAPAPDAGPARGARGPKS